MSHKRNVRSSFLAAISMGIASITIYAIAFFYCYNLVELTLLRESIGTD